VNPAAIKMKTIIRSKFIKRIITLRSSQENDRFYKFTSDDGFHLNGRRVHIKGVCLHHDQGLLWCGFLPESHGTSAGNNEKRWDVMQIRTSHNVPAPELLELCDKMGFIVN